MNLINKKVTHKRFGMGSIVKHNDSSIEIHFASENKKFVYPDVFGKYLKLHDKSAANSTWENYTKKGNGTKGGRMEEGRGKKTTTKKIRTSLGT